MAVAFAARSRAIPHVETNHVAHAMQRVASVLLMLGIECLIERAFQNSQLDQSLAQHTHRAGVRLEERISRAHRLYPNAQGFIDNFIHRSLLSGEPPEIGSVRAISAQ